MSGVSEIRRMFASPPSEGRPMMRWWWFGPVVERRELERQLRAMAAAGIGGVEVSFVYPLGPVETPFGSSEFYDQVRFAARRARELGLRFDLTLGSGWSFGGGHIGPELAARRLHWDRREITGAALDVPVSVLWPGDEFVAAFVGDGAAGTPSSYASLEATDGVIRVPRGSGPREVLVAYSRPTGQNVKRAAVGAEGPVLDHYSASAAAEHIRCVAEPLLAAATPELVGSVFCDSLEVYHADWTRDAFEEFSKRRGYDLRPRLYELLVDTGGSAQLRIDFYRTLSELYEKNFVAVFHRWASSHGVPFRIQSYGEPPATMSSYRQADLYEGEGWGWTRLPETRWASSAASIYGKSVVSAEAWTWVHSPSFRATPLDLKAEAHEHFLSGVNQLIGHGWPYSPSDAPGLGWFFYAAGALDDRNPWWPVAPELFGYLHRLSWLLRQGSPVRPVKVYVPASDAYAAMGPSVGGSLNLYREARRLIGDDIPRTIREAGLDFDLIDDDAVEVIDPAAVPVVVVPRTTMMPTATRQWLDDVAMAGGVVLVAAAPAAPAAPAALAARLAEVTRSGLALAPADDIGVVHRRLADAELFFLANTGSQERTFHVSGRTARPYLEQWDATTGETRGLGRSSEGIRVTLHPYEATVIAAVDESVPVSDQPSAEDEVRRLPLDGPWSARIGVETSPVTLPHRWEEEPGLSAYSGAVSYETEIDLADVDPAARVLLDFGDCDALAPETQAYLPPHSYRAQVTPPIGVAAEIWVNDTRCGTLWAPPYLVEISPAVRPGRNALRILIHNTAANALAADPHVSRLVEGATRRYGQRFQMQDLDHAADSVSSGLLTIPTLVIVHR
ncbi:glycosyl hydrolase [Actinopolymorpha alba]|uniref:glycosyl hydrolase n=1 Tax=Actinopolymorpha alba TaxID=533267 RepID=UPI00036CCB49|nr:glycosyl hydrolase [Actinopolymorpha alba]